MVAGDVSPVAAAGRYERLSTRVSRWLVLDISMPSIFRPLRRLILNAFDKENLRTMSAVKKYAEAPSGAAAED